MDLPPEKIVLPVADTSGDKSHQSRFKEGIKEQFPELDPGFPEQMGNDETESSRQLGGDHGKNNDQNMGSYHQTADGAHDEKRTFKTLDFGKKRVLLSHGQEFFRDHPHDQKEIDKEHHQAADKIRFGGLNIEKEQYDPGGIDHNHHRYPGSKKVHPADGTQQYLRQVRVSVAAVQQS